MKINELINELVSVKEKRAALTAEDSLLSKQAGIIEQDIMTLMAEAGTTKAASEEGHSVSVSKKMYPSIENWDALYAHIIATNSFDLLHKRPSITAFRDRWEATETIPGASASEVWEISLHKSRN